MSAVGPPKNSVFDQIFDLFTKFILVLVQSNPYFKSLYLGQIIGKFENRVPVGKPDFVCTLLPLHTLMWSLLKVCSTYIVLCLVSLVVFFQKTCYPCQLVNVHFLAQNVDAILLIPAFARQHLVSGWTLLLLFAVGFWFTLGHYC